MATGDRETCSRLIRTGTAAGQRGKWIDPAGTRVRLWDSAPGYAAAGCGKVLTNCQWSWSSSRETLDDQPFTGYPVQEVAALALVVQAPSRTQLRCDQRRSW